QKIRYHTQADRTRLFGMELNGMDVSLFDHGRVGLDVRAGGGCGVDDRRVVAVREIGKRFVVETCKQFRCPNLRERVPAHVRDARLAAEAFYGTGKNAEAARFGRFLARFEQALQADADAQKRNTRMDAFEQQFSQLKPVNGVHHLPKVSNARQDDLRRTAHRFGQVRDQIARAELFERVLNGADVPRTVIDDGGDGTCPNR